jgi:hypothetical protein
MRHSVIHFVKLPNRKGKQNANRTNSLDPRKSLDLRASWQVRNQCTLGIALWQSDLSEANFDRLIDGAIGAAQISYSAIGNTSPELALLISCVGRKLVLKPCIEEEVEGVQDDFGGETGENGFYSYGEISPFTPSAKC